MSQDPTIPFTGQACQSCGASIDGKDRVHFSYGATGSRERLYARVCQFSNSGSCINQGCDLQNIKPVDCFGTGNLNRQEYEKLQEKLTPKAA